MHVRHLTGAAALAVGVGLTGVPAAHAAALPQIPLGFNAVTSNARQWEARPSIINWADDPGYFYAARGGSVAHPDTLSWQWTSSSAYARGDVWLYNYSETNSGQAVFSDLHKYPVNLRFSKPERVGGRLTFGVATQHFTGALPAKYHFKRLQSVKLTCLKANGLTGCNYPFSS